MVEWISGKGDMIFAFLDDLGFVVAKDRVYYLATLHFYTGVMCVVCVPPLKKMQSNHDLNE